MHRGIRVIGLIGVICVAGCRVNISVPEDGFVHSSPGGLVCDSASQCMVEVTDYGFHETYSAYPHNGYIFIGWQKQPGGLCGGSLRPCELDASLLSASPALSVILESDAQYLLTPQFQPEQDVRAYKDGDSVLFEGQLTLAEGLASATEVPVKANLQLGYQGLEHAGSALMTASLSIASLDGVLLHTRSLEFWQGETGITYQYADRDGNTLLDSATNETGLLLLPVPLEPHAAIETPFAVMWGGHTSTPLTVGTRTIEVGEPQLTSTSAGDLSAYPVRIFDEYSYLVSYGEFKRGQHVTSEATLWISREKALVRLELEERIYSAAGLQLQSFQLSLDAARFNY